MLFNVKKLLNLPVYTESAVKLGEVSDINIDVESQVVREYLVRKNFFNKKNLFIKPDQVKEIKTDKMIVDDCLIKDLAQKTEKNNLVSAPALGNMMTAVEDDK